MSKKRFTASEAYSLGSMVFEISAGMTGLGPKFYAFWEAMAGRRDILAETITDVAIAAEEHLRSRRESWARHDFFLFTEAAARLLVERLTPDEGGIKGALVAAETRKLVAEAFAEADGKGA